MKLIPRRHHAAATEIWCRFIILARKDEPTCAEIWCQFIILARKDEPTSGNLVSVHHSCPRKSGVSSSFLPEKMNRHRAKKLGRGG